MNDNYWLIAVAAVACFFLGFRSLDYMAEWKKLCGCWLIVIGVCLSCLFILMLYGLRFKWM